jgi:hypothetical protein
VTRRVERASGGLSAARSTGASAIVFAFFLAIGAAYIVAAKSLGVSALWTTLIPLLIISTYATILGFARFLRLRDDQAGDNLYYLGFLYTLTSLGVSLWQFSASGGAETIVTNFGIAVSSTILGVALRVIFGQMRQDPLEVERSARLELAEAARRVRQELDSAVLELSSFRRATQQSLAEGMLETQKQIDLVSETVVGALKDLSERSVAPFEGASKQAGDALAKLSNTLASGLEQNANRLDQETSHLASTAKEMTEAIKGIEVQLKSLQMPDGVIEIKLQPTIRSMTKALKDLSERLGAQVDHLQAAVTTSAAATQEATAKSQAASDQLYQTMERFTTLLASRQTAMQLSFDRLVAALQRPRDSNSPTPPRAPVGERPAPTAPSARPNVGSVMPEADERSSGWRPWARK